jgi:hypothetical protein
MLMSSTSTGPITLVDAIVTTARVAPAGAMSVPFARTHPFVAAV